MLIAIIGIAVTLLIGILSLMLNFANREEDRSKAEQERLRQDIINQVKAEIYRDLAAWGGTGLPRERSVDRLVERDDVSGGEEGDDDDSDGKQNAINK